MYKKVQDILDREIERQNTTVELIASENFASQAVMDLCGSVFTNKYAEGYPNKRYYNGCVHIDEVETLAIDTVTRLYGSSYRLFVVQDIVLPFFQFLWCLKVH